MTPLLTKSEAAELLKVSITTLDRLTASGELPSIRISSRCIRYTPEALEAYASERSKPHQRVEQPWPFTPVRRRRKRF